MGVAMDTVQVVVFYDGKAWLAHALNVEVATFGDTREEARAAIIEALELYFEDADASECVTVIDPTFETVSLHAAPDAEYAA